MRYFFISILLLQNLLALSINIDTFKADFVQTITNEKKKVLTYKGSMKAAKPQYLIWNYTNPIKKDVYISYDKVFIIEPEIEQVIIKKIENSLDFFKIIKYSKKIDTNLYEANYNNTKFTLKIVNNIVEEISYIDEFDNSVKIVFSNQKKNENIDLKIFSPILPKDFDIVKG